MKDFNPRFAAGLSLGEATALCAAGAILVSRTATVYNSTSRGHSHDRGIGTDPARTIREPRRVENMSPPQAAILQRTSSWTALPSLNLPRMMYCFAKWCRSNPNESRLSNFDFRPCIPEINADVTIKFASLRSLIAVSSTKNLRCVLSRIPAS